MAAAGRAGAVQFLHRHRHRALHAPADPGTSTISSVAASRAMLPRVTASKQNAGRPAAPTTVGRFQHDQLDTLRVFTRAVSSTVAAPSASDISCIVNFQGIGQAGSSASIA